VQRQLSRLIELGLPDPNQSCVKIDVIVIQADGPAT
jgi:hypothetical protein